MCKRGQCRPVEMGNDLTSLDPVNTVPNCTLTWLHQQLQLSRSTAKYMLYSYPSYSVRSPDQNNVACWGTSTAYYTSENVPLRGEGQIVGYFKQRFFLLFFLRFVYHYTPEYKVYQSFLFFYVNSNRDKKFNIQT
jgi:hypothetical protein